MKKKMFFKDQEIIGLKSFHICSGLPDGRIMKISVNGQDPIMAKVWIDPKTMTLKIEPVNQEVDQSSKIDAQISFGYEV